MYDMLLCSAIKREITYYTEGSNPGEKSMG